MPQPRCQPHPPPGVPMERGLSPAQQRLLQPPRHSPQHRAPCGTPGVLGEEVGSPALPGCAHAAAWPGGHGKANRDPQGVTQGFKLRGGGGAW